VVIHPKQCPSVSPVIKRNGECRSWTIIFSIYFSPFSLLRTLRRPLNCLAWLRGLGKNPTYINLSPIIAKAIPRAINPPHRDSFATISVFCNRDNRLSVVLIDHSPAPHSGHFKWYSPSKEDGPFSNSFLIPKNWHRSQKM